MEGRVLEEGVLEESALMKRINEQEAAGPFQNAEF
jgi:hypothetical protein